MRRRWRRLRRDGEAGMTLIELLVAAGMSVVIVGATAAMLISAVRTQPSLSEQSQNVSSARWVLERMTREVRSGMEVTEATPSRVTFVGTVRRTACGGTTLLPGTAEPRECQIVYDCSSGDRCVRIERELEATSGGATTLLIDGLASANVFQYEPPGTPEKTYVGATLRLPNPEGPGLLTIADGASLRNATLLSSG